MTRRAPVEDEAVRFGGVLALAGAGASWRLQTPGGPVDVSFADRVFDALAGPDVAWLLLVSGLLGVLAGLGRTGRWLPGIAGALALLAALIALGGLPVNWAAVLLIGLAGLLAAADLAVLALAGFVVGSLWLYAPLGEGSEAAAGAHVSPWLLFVVTAALAGVRVLAGGGPPRALRRRFARPRLRYREP